MAEIKNDKGPKAETTQTEGIDTGQGAGTALATPDSPFTAQDLKNIQNIAGVAEDGEFIYAEELANPLQQGNGAVTVNIMNFLAGEPIGAEEARFRQVQGEGESQNGIAFVSQATGIETSPADEDSVSMVVVLGNFSDSQINAFMDAAALEGGQGTGSVDLEGSFTTPGMSAERVADLKDMDAAE